MKSHFLFVCIILYLELHQEAIPSWPPRRGQTVTVTKKLHTNAHVYMFFNRHHDLEHKSL